MKKKAVPVSSRKNDDLIFSYKHIFFISKIIHVFNKRLKALKNVISNKFIIIR